MRDFRQLTASGMGIEALANVDTEFYQDLAAVAGRLDLDSNDMQMQHRDNLRRCWFELMWHLDMAYGGKTAEETL